MYPQKTNKETEPIIPTWKSSFKNKLCASMIALLSPNELYFLRKSPNLLFSFNSSKSLEKQFKRTISRLHELTSKNYE